MTITAISLLGVVAVRPVLSQSTSSAARTSASVDQRVLESLKNARDPVSMETVAMPPGATGSGKASGPDLSVARITLDASGRIRYTAANAAPGQTINPFVADVLVDGERKDTIKHPPLGAFSAHMVTTATLFPDCGNHQIRVVLDPQQIVAEAAENNNARSESVTPPCADLAIARVEKNWTDSNTRFRAQVTVRNVGNLASPAGITLLVNTGGLGTPQNSFVEVGVLQPGESRSFTVGPKFVGTTTVSVTAFVDFYKKVVEKSEANNETTTTI